MMYVVSYGEKGKGVCVMCVCVIGEVSVVDPLYSLGVRYSGNCTLLFVGS